LAYWVEVGGKMGGGGVGVAGIVALIMPVVAPFHAPEQLRRASDKRER